MATKTAMQKNSSELNHVGYGKLGSVRPGLGAASPTQWCTARALGSPDSVFGRGPACPTVLGSSNEYTPGAMVSRQVMVSTFDDFVLR